jgi:pimeloyl-ACP methyl ester carboxylesterase
VLQPPSFRARHGRLVGTYDWLRGELAQRPGPLVLGGHSFGAALAVVAAAREWASIGRLVLVSPAGLPLSKPMHRAGLMFVRQLVTGTYPVRPAVASALRVASAPVGAHRLARQIYALDLRPELEVIRERGLPVSVLTAVSDTLTTCAACRELARLAGGTCEELDVPGAHVWFLSAGPLFRERLAL